jgi:hypothetical protein
MKQVILIFGCSSPSPHARKTRSSILRPVMASFTQVSAAGDVTTSLTDFSLWS